MFQKQLTRQFSKGATIIFFTGLLFACSGKVVEENSEMSDLEIGALNEHLFEKGLTILNPWTSYWTNLGMTEGRSTFKQTGDLKIELLERPEVNPIKEGHPLANVQFDHPTNQGTVDIYHYKLHVGDALDVSFEPDGEVIYYRDNGMRERLLFIGPSGLFEDAAWIDEVHLMVVGYFESEAGISPMVWLINIEESSYQLFESDLVVSNVDRYGYLKGKLSALDFAP